MLHCHFMRYSDNWAQNIKLHLFSNYLLAVMPFYRHHPPPRPSLPHPLPSYSGGFSIFPAFCAFLHPLINSPSSHFLPIHSSLQQHSERLRGGFCELARGSSSRLCGSVKKSPPDAASFASLVLPGTPHRCLCTCRHISTNV